MPISKFATSLTITKELLEIDQELRDAMVVEFVENSIACLKETIKDKDLEFNDVNIDFSTHLK